MTTLYLFSAAAAYAWLHRFSAALLLVCGFIAVGIIVGIIFIRNQHEWLVRPMFITAISFAGGAAAVFALATGFLTLKAPGHQAASWQAGISFWSCGEQLTVQKPPKGMSTHIGTTPYFYDGNTQTLHYEGLPKSAQPDANVSSFLEAMGGSLTSRSFSLPIDTQSIQFNTLNSQLISTDQNGKSAINVANGKSCKDSNDQAAVQVFAFTINRFNNTYKQEKVTNPEQLVIGQESDPHLAQCIIIEFDTPKAKTEHLCQSYGERDDLRCTQYGVPVNKQGGCTLHEVSLRPTAGGEL